MQGERPILYGIPFSHYCQKTEWGLTQAGIAYDYVSISLPKMVDLPKFTKTGLVPAMIANGELMEGSDLILRWASHNQAPNTALLHPVDSPEVAEWEQWAGEIIGPVARREAYRVAYDDPWKFHYRFPVRMAAFLAHGMILNILKYYKSRRFDGTDAEAVPEIIAKVVAQLEHTGTGYLLGEHPTAADHAVAALSKPLTYAVHGRDYAELDGWEPFVAFIDRMQPAKTLRASKRRISPTDWTTLKHLSAHGLP